MKEILSIFLLLAAFSCKTQGQQTLVFNEKAFFKPVMTDKTVLEWNQNQPDYEKLSSDEQGFFYWVNYSRLEPVYFFDSIIIPLVQTYPQLKGSNLTSLGIDLKNIKSLPLFSLNNVLLDMATDHAKDITSKNAAPSHNSTDGETFVERFKKLNLKNCGGENIGYGTGDTDPLFILILLYLDIHVPDLGHRKALLNSSYTNTGIAISKFKNNDTFLVEDFACNQK